MGLQVNFQRVVPYVQPIGIALISGAFYAHTAALCLRINPLTAGVFSVAWTLFNNIINNVWAKFVHPQNPLMSFKWPVCYFGSFTLAGITTNAIGFPLSSLSGLILEVTAIGLFTLYCTAIAGTLAGIAVIVIVAKAHSEGITLEEAARNILDQVLDTCERHGIELREFLQELREIFFGIGHILGIG